MAHRTHLVRPCVLAAGRVRWMRVIRPISHRTRRSGGEKKKCVHVQTGGGGGCGAAADRRRSAERSRSLLPPSDPQRSEGTEGGWTTTPPCEQANRRTGKQQGVVGSCWNRTGDHDACWLAYTDAEQRSGRPAACGGSNASLGIHGERSRLRNPRNAASCCAVTARTSALVA